MLASKVACWTFGQSGQVKLPCSKFYAMIYQFGKCVQVLKSSTHFSSIWWNKGYITLLNDAFYFIVHFMNGHSCILGVHSICRIWLGFPVIYYFRMPLKACLQIWKGQSQNILILEAFWGNLVIWIWKYPWMLHRECYLKWGNVFFYITIYFKSLWEELWLCRTNFSVLILDFDFAVFSVRP